MPAKGLEIRVKRMKESKLEEYIKKLGLIRVKPQERNWKKELERVEQLIRVRVPYYCGHCKPKTKLKTINYELHCPRCKRNFGADYRDLADYLRRKV